MPYPLRMHNTQIKEKTVKYHGFTKIIHRSTIKLGVFAKMQKSLRISGDGERFADLQNRSHSREGFCLRIKNNRGICKIIVKSALK